MHNQRARKRVVWRDLGLALGFGLVVLGSLSLPSARAEEATLATPSVLPTSGYRHTIKWWGRSVSGFFVFRSESRALYQTRQATEHLAEAKTMVAQGKPNLANEALRAYDKSAGIAERRLEAIDDRRLQQPRAASIVEQIDADSTKQLSVIQEIDIDTQDSANADLKKTLQDEALPASQDLVDLSSDKRSEPPMPPELLNQLQTFLKLGIIDNAKLEELTKATRRSELRDKIELLINNGDAPADLIAKFDAAKIDDRYKESADKLKVYAALQSFKAITLASTMAPPSQEQLDRLNNFKATYKPGDPIPDNLKRFILPNLFGAQLAEDLVKNAANFNSNQLKTDLDRKFFERVKSQFTIGGGAVQAQGDKFSIPVDFDLAAGFVQFAPVFAAMQQQMQSQVAEAIAQFKQNAQGNYQTNGQFQAQFASQLGFNPRDQRFVPPGFKPEEFRGSFQYAVRPETFGFPPLPKGKNGEPDQEEFDRLVKEGKFVPPAAPPPGMGLANFVQQFGGRPPEEVARMYAPPPPGQYMQQYQQTGQLPLPPAMDRGQMQKQWETNMEAWRDGGSQGQPPPSPEQNFGLYNSPMAFMPQNFRPPEGAIRAYEQNKDKYQAMEVQSRQQMDNRQRMAPPAFNQLQQSGQLKQFEQQNQPGQDGRQPSEPFRRSDGQPTGPMNSQPGQYRPGTDSPNQPQNQPTQPQPYQPPPNQPAQPYQPPTNTQPPPASQPPPQGAPAAPPPQTAPPPPAQSSNCVSASQMQSMMTQWQANFQNWEANGQQGTMPPNPSNTMSVCPTGFLDKAKHFFNVMGNLVFQRASAKGAE